MKKHLSLLTLALMLCATLSAAVPFKVTTITDGTFAPGTQWYTMHLGEGKSVLSDNGTADFIAIVAAPVTAPNPPTTDFFRTASNAVKRFSAAPNGPEKFFSNHCAFLPAAVSAGEALSKMENSVLI